MFQRARIDDGVKIPPPLIDWELQNPWDKPMQVTFRKARRTLWDQFRKEHVLFINNVKKLKSPGDDVGIGSVDKVYQFVFGPNSTMALLFYDRLGILK